MIHKSRYFSPDLRSVETVADVASMVVNSDGYLELARQKGPSGLHADKSSRTGLGWFKTKAGEVHSRIELADAKGVEFLMDGEVKKLAEKT